MSTVYPVYKYSYSLNQWVAQQYKFVTVDGKLSVKVRKS